MIRRSIRDLPRHIEGYGPVKPYSSTTSDDGVHRRTSVKVACVRTGDSKLLESIAQAFRACGVTDGATLSFHHHMRNGDRVMNMVLAEAARLGLKNLTIAPSSIFPVHEPLVEHIRSGVITGIHTAYVTGPVADAISSGLLKSPAVLQTHGGRARAIESGELVIDVAFVAAPTADDYGNINGVQGKSACGVLGYAQVDVRYAQRVVAITDNLVAYPACPADITQDLVDFVVEVPQIGDASQIVSGTTRVTEDPAGLQIARNAVEVMEAAGLMKNGLSFQTGAGGISLAVARFVQERMCAKGIRGSFASGGITGKIVEMLETGLFETLWDTQCFDLEAVRSFRSNPKHQGMSASLYGNPWNRGAVVNRLDTMILGATEIDLDFNVNVTTRSDGMLTGGSGGHADTACGCKLAIVTTKLMAGKYPKIVERVTTITTPGETIDAVVTDAGIAINPRHTELIEKIKAADLDIKTIDQLFEIAHGKQAERSDATPVDSRRIVAVQQYRDGSVIDVVRQAKFAS